MIQQPLVSDLVHDSKIETVLDGNVAQHTYYSSGQSARERIVRRKETWVRDGSTAFLGQGAYGTVFRERCDQRLRAVKAIKKCVVVGEELDYARELEAIIKFSHPKYSHCFVRSYGWFESADSVFITMEYLRHGDLQKRLTQPLPEGQARQIIAQVLEGLQHMHNNGFVHRELKPGNIMIVTPGPEWFVKITDFGISKRRQECATTLHTLQRGAFGFAAPEALGLGSDDSRASYTFAVDMWSLGAVTYKILTSVAPFQSLVDLFRYATGILDFPLSELYTHNITKTAQDLVLTLMSPQPNRRPSASAASGHLWFTSDIGDLPRHELELPETLLDQKETETNVSVASASRTSECTTSTVIIPPPLNYKSPSVEDCSDEAEIDIAQSLPADSKILLMEASEIAFPPPQSSDEQSLNPWSTESNDSKDDSQNASEDDLHGSLLHPQRLTAKAMDLHNKRNTLPSRKAATGSSTSSSSIESNQAVRGSRPLYWLPTTRDSRKPELAPSSSPRRPNLFPLPKSKKVHWHDDPRPLHKVNEATFEPDDSSGGDEEFAMKNSLDSDAERGRIHSWLMGIHAPRRSSSCLTMPYSDSESADERYGITPQRRGGRRRLYQDPYIENLSYRFDTGGGNSVTRNDGVAPPDEERQRDHTEQISPFEQSQPKAYNPIPRQAIPNYSPHSGPSQGLHRYRYIVEDGPTNLIKSPDQAVLGQNNRDYGNENGTSKPKGRVYPAYM